MKRLKSYSSSLLAVGRVVYFLSRSRVVFSSSYDMTTLQAITTSCHSLHTASSSRLLHCSYDYCVKEWYWSVGKTRTTWENCCRCTHVLITTMERMNNGFCVMADTSDIFYTSRCSHVCGRQFETLWNVDSQRLGSLAWEGPAILVYVNSASMAYWCFLSHSHLPVLYLFLLYFSIGEGPDGGLSLHWRGGGSSGFKGSCTWWFPEMLWITLQTLVEMCGWRIPIFHTELCQRLVM
jgi:hypothetical protein